MKQKFYTFFIALLAVFMLYPSLAMAKTNMGTIYMKVGESRQLTSEPSTYYTVTGEWSKTGDAIRIISSGNRSCTISALRVGTATVTWIGYIDTTWEEMYWTVYVESPQDIKVTSITLNKTSLTLQAGKSETLTATVKPDNATNKSVSWSSNNTSVASVSSTGEVYASAKGNATITCKANDGSGVSASCAVTVEGEVPPPPELTGNIMQVSAGGSHTMILMKDGTLWACGYNKYGQLCDGTTTKCNTPKQVMTGVAAVSAGSGYTMIIKTDGSLWACGSNDYGQLGDGTTIDRTTPKQVMTGVAAVAAGSYHTMIVKTDGTLWGCGRNESGELGIGTTTNSSTPKYSMSDVKAVSAGYSHTLILKTDNSLWGCGHNLFGELGNIHNYDDRIRTPEQMMTNVKAVATGNSYSMILKNDGTLWSCGEGSHGKLGNGTTYTYNRTPKQIMSNVTMVSARSYHTMMVKENGSLWACGFNYSGQLGDGTTTDRSTPIQVMTGVQFAVTGSHYTIISKTDGSLWACGSNEDGQLGDGTYNNRNSPTKVKLKVYPIAISLSRNSLDLIVNDSFTLTYSYDYPTGTTSDEKISPSVTWTSSNSDVVTVSEGKLKGIKPGTSIITVKSANGLTASCSVTVTGIKVTSITLNKTTLSLHPGQTVTLTATVKPDNATDKTVTWKSEDPTVATVDSNGKVTVVTPVNGAEGAITCTANDGSGVSATCWVTVTPILPESISLPSSMTVAAGQTVTLTPTITPADAVTTLTWSSDDETIATVNSSGVVTGVKKGQTFINVETNNGKAAYCKLTVTAGEPTEIVLPKNVTVTIGTPLTITATVIPEGAETALTWKSDDETIVRVNGSGSLTGLLTGVAEGLAIVTVSTSNGLTSNVCKVKVEPDPSGINDVQMVESNNVPVFTLSGQRLAAPKKGINIVGGKKMVVK